MQSGTQLCLWSNLLLLSPQSAPARLVLLFLQHTRYSPASGLLHGLSFLSGMLFPYNHIACSFTCTGLLIKCVIFPEAFLDHLFKNYNFFHSLSLLYFSPWHFSSSKCHVLHLYLYILLPLDCKLH